MTVPEVNTVEVINSFPSYNRIVLLFSCSNKSPVSSNNNGAIKGSEITPYKSVATPYCVIVGGLGSS